MGYEKKYSSVLRHYQVKSLNDLTSDADRSFEHHLNMTLGYRAGDTGTYVVGRVEVFGTVMSLILAMYKRSVSADKALKFRWTKREQHSIGSLKSLLLIGI